MPVSANARVSAEKALDDILKRTDEEMTVWHPQKIDPQQPKRVQEV
jgi:hypothetical protein